MATLKTSNPTLYKAIMTACDDLYEEFFFTYQFVDACIALFPNVDADKITKICKNYDNAIRMVDDLKDY
jgi:hypothetical protein